MLFVTSLAFSLDEGPALVPLGDDVRLDAVKFTEKYRIGWFLYMNIVLKKNYNILLIAMYRLDS